jgi:two-component system response regulator VicR
MKALIIEDDQSIIDAIRVAFEFRWPDVVLYDANSGNHGVSLVSSESPDIVILDLNLPDTSGFDILKEIRGFSTVPVIILTVRSEDEDIMKGLEAGADDYITKPFNYLTLLARVKAVLRRTKMLPFKGSHNNLINARLSIDFVNQQVKVDNKLVKLTPLEYKLLVALVKNRNRVVPFDMISREVWGTDCKVDAGKIKIGVRRLRKKLNDLPPQMILNKRGTGYIFKN